MEEEYSIIKVEANLILVSHSTVNKDEVVTILEEIALLERMIFR